ncbi:MAG: HAMP domain-containing histidine kinase [Roseivirga sp.]|nr:HAMP domain-containing histidine kinase [Roseivirga sp.]
MIPNHIVNNQARFIRGRLIVLTLLLALYCQSLPGQIQSPEDFDKLINEGHMLIREGKRQASFDTFFKALNEAKHQESEKYFDVLTALTFHLYYSDTYGEFYPLEERFRYIDEAIRLALELKEDSIYTNKIYHKGVLHNINESSDSALFYFEKTIEWAAKIGNNNILLQAYSFKSRILRNRGDLDAAYKLLIEYEREAARLKDYMHLQTVTEALGHFFTVQEDHKKSIVYFKKAIVLARDHNIDAYYSLASLAGSYIDTDSLRLARIVLKQAVDEIERVHIEDEYDQGYSFKKMSANNTLGYLHSQRLQQYDSALYYYELGLSDAEKLNYKESIVETKENISEVYQVLGKYDQALDVRIENYPLVLEISNLNLRVQVEKNMAENYELLGLYEKAVEHFKANQVLSDSLLNIQQLEAVARLETEYETEKKEQEIALLNARNDRQQARQVAFIVTGGLLAVILVVVFIALRGKQKANRLITSQKEILAENNQQLKQLGEFKENLTHMIVHDMKNPLNAVIGLSQGEASQQKLSTIAQSGHQMLNMVSNMLDVQKFKETQVTLNTEAHLFNNLFKEASIHLELLMHAKKVALTKSIPNKLYVDVDGELIVRVVGNLLSNALKYSDLGGEILVEASIDTPAKEVTISVIDHGPGIATEQLPNVFDKYWQGHDQDSHYSGSTGLGLTFCKLAVEAHGGKISVDSEYGKSTTFSFTIPMVQAEHIEQSDMEVAKPIDLGESLILESDIAVLSKYFSQLGELKVHQVGKINSIIRELEEAEVTSPWKSNLISAMHQGNQQRFDELVAMLK